MTLQHQQFLNILRCALVNRPASCSDALTDGDWEALMELAGDQKLLPLFSDAIHTVPGTETVLPKYRPAIRRQVLVQALKTEEFLRLYRHLEQAGIRPLVVKGILLRTMYPKPDLRPSADEDLVVKPEEFAAARQALEDFGMVCVSQNQDREELAFRKPDSALYIELHSALFPDGNDAYGQWNDLFGDVFQRAETVEIQGVSMLAPCAEDHLLYLIGHAMKHFLHSGFGIRQVCDVCVFARNYGNRLDWSRVISGCDQLHAREFTAAMLAIGTRHLGFDPEEARIPAELLESVDEMPMLEDLLSGGVYGTASKTRTHSATVTLAAASADQAGKEAKTSVLPSLFPPARALEGRYPWLKDKPWLLPAAWGMRIVSYGKELRTDSGNSAIEALQIGEQRVELLRYYGIIGKKG